MPKEGVGMGCVQRGGGDGVCPKRGWGWGVFKEGVGMGCVQRDCDGGVC